MHQRLPRFSASHPWPMCTSPPSRIRSIRNKRCPKIFQTCSVLALITAVTHSHVRLGSVRGASSGAVEEPTWTNGFISFPFQDWQPEDLQPQQILLAASVCAGYGGKTQSRIAWLSTPSGLATRIRRASMQLPYPSKSVQFFPHGTKTIRWECCS